MIDNQSDELQHKRAQAVKTAWYSVSLPWQFSRPLLVLRLLGADLDLKQKNRRTTRRLVLVAVGMFGFGFALWPLYTVLCEVTGLGGRAVQVSENNSGSSGLRQGR